MYRMLLVAMLLTFSGGNPACAESLLAPVYPGAVPFGENKPGHFLSKDSFDQARAFYLKERGTVTREETHPARGRFAFFEYMDVHEVHKYDPVGSAIGVRIHAQTLADGKDMETSLPVVGDLFGTLKMLTVQGSLSQAEYNRLVGQYRHLATWYYPLSTASSYPRPMNEVILDRCESGPAEETAQQDAEAMAMKAQELMMQGRQREALEILQRLGQSAQGAYEQSLSPQGVDKWKECLAELERHGYPTRIEIALDPSR